MRISTRPLAAVLMAGGLTVLGSSAVLAQSAWNGGGSEAIGQSTSLPLPAGAVSSDEVAAGAVAASHPAGTEAVGQSTSTPAMISQVSDTEVYNGAVATAHTSGAEALGQSTALPMPGAQ